MAWWIFQNVGVTALLAAVVALICRTTRLGPVARHALWVLVLVKFVTPPLVSWPWTAPDPFGVSALDARWAAAPVAVARTLDGHRPTDAIDDAAIAIAPAVDSRGRCARGSVRGPHGAHDMALARDAVGGGKRGADRHRRREARRDSPVRSAARARPAPRSSIASPPCRPGSDSVPSRCSSSAASPHRWCGVWAGRGCSGRRGCQPDASDACVDGLLVHELAHVKRRDHLVGWIELAAGVVWWWNPCSGSSDRHCANKPSWRATRGSSRRCRMAAVRMRNRCSPCRVRRRGPRPRWRSSASAPPVVVCSKGDSS